MHKVKLTKFVLNLIIITLIFLADRISKIYILKKADVQNIVDIYLNPYVNFYLIWNKGIAFGLFSFEGNFLYNLITLVIIVIVLTVFVLTIKAKGFRRYALLFVLGGALGNLFDRIYYTAVPDFIDLHINNFHWFVFNVADIFITLGIICLISAEIFLKDN
jgi:signal peptidase II|tara:strand:+ start:1023 stop:1505 length:483 start_codon:yes stop_codon:yes gene_type:complete